MKEKQNKNIIFLNLLYQNAQMGLIGIDAVLKKINDESIAKLISKQRKEYDHFLNDVRKILIKYGAKEEEIGKLKEISATFMSDMMSINKSDQEIVKLMMEGNEKGLLEVTAQLNQYEGEDEEIVCLAKKLLDTEEHNREELKKYL